MTNKPQSPDLEAILHALTNPEPPPGMQQRILANLANHARTTDQVQPSPARPFFARTSFLLPSFTVAAAIAVLLGFHLSHHTQAFNPTIQTASTPIPTHFPEPSTSRPYSSHAAPIPQSPIVPSYPRKLSNSAASAIQTSFPAPPLPLTPQEQLLLRVAHQTTPRDAAAMDAPSRERQSIRAAVEFETFFAQPIPPPQPTAPNPDPTLTGDDSWQPTLD